MTEPNDAPYILEEYGFTDGTRGNYAARNADGTSVVLLAPDVAAHFRDGEAVNNALRHRVAVIEAQHKGQST